MIECACHVCQTENEYPSMFAFDKYSIIHQPINDRIRVDTKVSITETFQCYVFYGSVNGMLRLFSTA